MVRKALVRRDSALAYSVADASEHDEDVPWNRTDSYENFMGCVCHSTYGQCWSRSNSHILDPLGVISRTKIRHHRSSDWPLPVFFRSRPFRAHQVSWWPTLMRPITSKLRAIVVGKCHRVLVQPIADRCGFRPHRLLEIEVLVFFLRGDSYVAAGASGSSRVPRYRPGLPTSLVLRHRAVRPQGSAPAASRPRERNTAPGAALRRLRTECPQAPCVPY